MVSLTELIKLISESKFHDLNLIIDDAEGIMPVDQLNDFLVSNNFNVDEIAYPLAKFLVYKGIFISSNENRPFFEIFSNSKKNPGLSFWIY